MSYDGSAERLEDQQWDAVFSPSAGWLDWRLGEVWSHRDLVRLLIWRDFVTVHKQTILGPLWHVVSPILTALTLTLVFGTVIKLPTDGVPPILFYMAGTVAWNYFTACFFKTSNSLAANAGLFGKVYFHRFVVPLSAVLSSLISFSIQCGILAVMAIAFSLKGSAVHPGLWLLAVPAIVMLLGGYGLAFGLICSALTTRYRDLSQLIGFGVQLLMFATPIIYPSSAVDPHHRWVLAINPLAPLIEGFRYAWVGKGDPQTGLLLLSGAVLVAMMTVGLTLFTRAERTFLDTV